MVAKKKQVCNCDEMNSKQLKIVEMELELSRLNRERSNMVLNKAVLLYFCFIGVGVITTLNGDTTFFNILIVLGIAALVIGFIPYIRTSYAEDKKIHKMIDDLKKN